MYKSKKFNCFQKYLNGIFPLEVVCVIKNALRHQAVQGEVLLLVYYQSIMPKYHLWPVKA
jgi:hypothetical protein